MIAAETLLALHPQPPRVATIWDHSLPWTGSIHEDWRDRTTEEVVRDLHMVINAMLPRVHPYEPAHYHAVHTH